MALHLIDETILSVAAASIEFTSIPADYRHLLLIAVLKGTNGSGSVNASVRFNGDSGGNYDFQGLRGSNGVSAFEALAQTSARLGIAPGTVASATGMASGSVLYIPDYSRTVWQKAGIAASAHIQKTTTGGMVVDRLGQFWRDTSAITTITVIVNAGNWEVGSLITLYGLD